MKILLIYPHCLEQRAHELHSEDVEVTPIGLYYIGALLIEHGYDVEIINWYKQYKDTQAAAKMLKEKNPDVIGLSIVNANRFGGIDIAGTAKKILPDVKIIFGGIGTTFLWEHLLHNFPEIDYAVLGEGEHAFLHLLDCIEGGGKKSLEEMPGLAFRQGEEIVCTGQAEPTHDLDQLPDPAKYFTFQHLVSSRGCPSACSFCGSPKFWGRKVRFHSPAYFANQLEQLYRKGINFFYISDDTFTLDKDRVISICREIISRKLNITWFAIARVNHVDCEMLLWMRRAGCIQISYGVESGSADIRKALKKNISDKDIERAFNLTVSYGILARAYFIYGSPGESRQTINESIDLMNRIKPLSAIFYILEIFPGTGLYEDFKRRTGKGDDIWLQKIEHINYFETDDRLCQEQIIEFGRMLRMHFYQSLPDFVRSVRPADLPELYMGHADFLSRLGMTFSHGDYASIENIPEKQALAETLYRLSLNYEPNERAFLGLGIILQKQGRYEESAEKLAQGLDRFPANENLAACLCVSWMNLGMHAEVVKCAQSFPASSQIQKFAHFSRQAISGHQQL